MSERGYRVIVIGGGHAGVEAAWACANLFQGQAGAVALVTLDPAKIGVMSCNPAIGGLAKGQLVREVDALGGLMGLATDATGIQFRMLNTSKGPAVHGPRAQCDKHAYAEAVQRFIASRPEIDVVAGAVERLTVENGEVRGVTLTTSPERERAGGFALASGAVVLTTGTFMRGLMHCGEQKTAGGRFGEGAAVGISGALRELGFELGRLKTGTPPRLRRSTINWDSLEPQHGDPAPLPFSDLNLDAPTFPVLPQVECRQTRTTAASHDLIRANLARAPMYSGQIESAGPRYCPSIEDKIVRFAERDSHGVFLEPESLRDDWIYCNGISTSLPPDVQDGVVRSMPGCEQAEILRYGYAVEYDMVRPHQIFATGMTKLVRGLFLAGQINGTSGYEEAAAQGVVAGINAARYVQGQSEVTIGRERAYIGVLMDDLVTRTPVEPYRMFTSRAEHRLVLRADNAADRLTQLALELGLLDAPLGRERARLFDQRSTLTARMQSAADRLSIGGQPLARLLRSDTFTVEDFRAALAAANEVDATAPPGVLAAALRTVHADRRYEPYQARQQAELRRGADMERRTLPDAIDYTGFTHMRTEAREALTRFRPATFGQAGRLEGVTPADLTLLSVLVEKWKLGGDRRGARAVTA